MFNINIIMYSMLLIVSSAMVVSSENWLSIWMGLELNLIFFIPIIHKPKNLISSESCMIYFLIQSMSSILFLISILNSPLIMNSPFMSNELFKILLMISLMIKLGMSPFHFWLPDMLNKMSWFKCAILMTWQKLAPITILYFVIKNNYSPLIIFMSLLTGAIGGISQTSMRKIMGYSSISHMGWMIACMNFTNEMWINYLIIYSCIIFSAAYIMKTLTIYYLNQLTSANLNNMNKFLIFSTFLSMGGLPPFIGFLPKWMVLQSMILSNSMFMMIIMILSSLTMLFFYLRMISSSLLMNSITFKWFKKTNLSKKMVTMFMLINLCLPAVAILSF